ncbi:hypothetical protein SHXM_02019 [Streptomyces hygroscopicus]|nr:hypothetical protein SHXM_02019 [Streptomyces hygroscopicus]
MSVSDYTAVSRRNRLGELTHEYEQVAYGDILSGTHTAPCLRLSSFQQALTGTRLEIRKSHRTWQSRPQLGKFPLFERRRLPFRVTDKVGMVSTQANGVISSQRP